MDGAIKKAAIRADSQLAALAKIQWTRDGARKGDRVQKSQSQRLLRISWNPNQS